MAPVRQLANETSYACASEACVGSSFNYQSRRCGPGNDGANTSGYFRSDHCEAATGDSAPAFMKGKEREGEGEKEEIERREHFVSFCFFLFLNRNIFHFPSILPPCVYFAFARRDS